MNENFFVLLFILLYFSPVYYHLYIAIKESRKGNRKYLRKIKKVLKWSCLILIVIAGVTAILSHTNYLDYEEPIEYNQIDEITFENFRGIELFKKSLYGNERFAYVSTSIEISFQSNSVIVQSLFHPSRSFVYNKNSNSKELLNHEIFHFKITELYVRKMKQRISALKNPSDEEIEEIINDLKTGEVNFQKSYDYDTFHSYVYGEQKRYERLIDSSLNSLKDFTKPKLNFHEIP